MTFEILQKELVNLNFEELNHSYWENIQNKIFSNEIPSSYEWTDLKEIVSVLNIIGSFKGSNQMFYPTGGSFDIESAKLGSEDGCIEIFTGHVEIVKPTKLIFTSFSDNSDWNFFRLETENLNTSDVYGDRVVSSEELVEIEKGKYICRSYWDEEEFGGEKIPVNARLVTRHLNGSFVIFSDKCPYDALTTVGVKHNELNSEDFVEYIKRNI